MTVIPLLRMGHHPLLSIGRDDCTGSGCLVCNGHSTVAMQYGYPHDLIPAAEPWTRAIEGGEGR